MDKKDVLLNRSAKNNMAIYDEARSVSSNPNVISRKGLAKTIVPEGGDIDEGIQADQQRVQANQNMRYTSLMKNIPKGDME